MDINITGDMMGSYMRYTSKLKRKDRKKSRCGGYSSDELRENKVKWRRKKEVEKE